MRSQRTLLLLVALGLAWGAAGLLAAGSPAAASVDPQPASAGEEAPGRVRTDVASADLQPLLNKASQLRDRLRFPVGTRRETGHVRDARSRQEYDEVNEKASNGQMLSLIRFAPDGELVAAIRLDTPIRGRTIVTEDVATTSARNWAGVAGLSVGKPNRASHDPSGGGWRVEWDRIEDGIPVRNDGVVITLWRDGTIAGIGRPWSQLGAKPEVVIDEAQAKDLAQGFLRQMVGSDLRHFPMQSQKLEWIQPNDTFDIAEPIAGDQTTRLAWVVDFEASGPARDNIFSVTLYVDAGDGRLLGGDYVG